jgi:hypothetical protein
MKYNDKSTIDCILAHSDVRLMYLDVIKTIKRTAQMRFDIPEGFDCRLRPRTKNVPHNANDTQYNMDFKCRFCF